METLSLFGLSIANCTLQEAVSRVLKQLAGEHPTSIYFVNAHCVNVAHQDREYLHILRRSSWVYADGVGMKIAAALHGYWLRGNVNGTDLYPVLLPFLENTGYRIYLLGAEPGIAERMRERALEKHPDLIFAGIEDGFYPPESEESVIARIREARTDLLLVAMGVPRQEKWLARNLAATGAKVGIGVGGLFNFYSGAIPRAPLWMRKVGLEWFHRFCMEPSRLWKRYLVGHVQFLWLVLKSRIRS